jgi:hypothetical protein
VHEAKPMLTSFLRATLEILQNFIVVLCLKSSNLEQLQPLSTTFLILRKSWIMSKLK